MASKAAQSNGADGWKETFFTDKSCKTVDKNLAFDLQFVLCAEIIRWCFYVT